MTCLGKVPWPSASLDTGCLGLEPHLDTVPRPKAMTCLDKVFRFSAFIDTVPRPSAITCLDKTPRPSACLGTEPQPSAKPRNSASAKCHDIPR